ncbi:MAG: hypothetical protein WCI12_06850 [Actinomycetes bacterium]
MSGAHRRIESATTFRRRRTVALAFVLVVVVLVGLIFTRSTDATHEKDTGRPKASRTTVTVRPTTTTKPAPPTSTTDPGTLPQTDAKPPVDVASVSARLAPLWAAIQSGNLATAMTVFFPESAYLTMKTGVIPAPAADYQGRLVGLFTIDLATYNQAVGSPSSAARLLGFSVDPTLAHWVTPGTCANLIGYWHLPNIRITYSNGSQTRSFGVFSLISWRGQWYVVHLGPVPRSSGAGLLDLPATGSGTPGPGGGC